MEVLQQMLAAARAIPPWSDAPPAEALVAPTCEYDHLPGGCPDRDCVLLAAESRQWQLGRSSWADFRRLVDGHPEVMEAVPGLREVVDACGACVLDDARKALILFLVGAVKGEVAPAAAAPAAEPEAPAAAVDPDAWVDADTAAKMLGITVRTLRRWRDAGTAPPWTQVGGSIRFKVADIVEWLNAGKVRSTSEAAVRSRRT